MATWLLCSTLGHNRKVEDTESLVYTKWPQLIGHKLKLSCLMGDIGECFLEDDSELASMVAICHEVLLTRCDVHVRIDSNARVEVAGLGNEIGDNRAIMSCINYDPGLLDTDLGLAFEGENSSKKLLSAEWKDLIKHEGRLFPGGPKESRKALVKFSVANAFEYRLLKNEESRVTAECKLRAESTCEWRIHASEDKPNGGFVIRNYYPEHQCGHIFGKASTKKLTSRVIIDLISDDIHNMPRISPRDVQSQVKDNFGVNISYYVAWRSTDVGRNLIFGDHSKSYSSLPAYFAEAERTNPDSVFDLELHPERKNFRRWFFAFGPCLQGFKSCCPVLMINRTFMKCKHQGILLRAVGKDGLFPLAFAIISEETDDNWNWFLKHLKLAIDNRSELVFVSDRNHGILEGVKNIFPESKHCYYYKHLTANLKDKFWGVPRLLRDKVVKQFADCSYASTKDEVDSLYAKLLATGGQRFRNFIADLPREKW